MSEREATVVLIPVCALMSEDQPTHGQHLEEIGRVGPIRVSVLHTDKPEVPSTRLDRIVPMIHTAKLKKAGITVFKPSEMSDMLNRVKQAFHLMHEAGIPERVLATRIVFDATWRYTYAEAEYDVHQDYIRAHVSTDSNTLIHELAHRVYYKGLGNVGRARWHDFIESSGEPLSDMVKRIVFALSMSDLWDELYPASVTALGEDEDADGLWAEEMQKLERSPLLTKNLLGNMAIEDYVPMAVLKKIPKTDSSYQMAHTLWGYIKDQRSTSAPRALIKWLDTKTVMTALPSNYANTDPAEGWAEAVMDILSGPYGKNRLEHGTREKIKHEVLAALGVVHEALHEEVVKIPNGLGLARDELPQIDSDKVDDFLNWLREQGVTVWPTPATARLLLPSQGELETDKVAALKKQPEKLTTGKIITSLDGYVLDGHHRWAAFVELYPEGSLETWQVGLPIRELIAMVERFPGRKVRDIAGKKVSESMTEATEKLPDNADPLLRKAALAAVKKRGLALGIINSKLAPNGWSWTADMYSEHHDVPKLAYYFMVQKPNTYSPQWTAELTVRGEFEHTTLLFGRGSDVNTAVKSMVQKIDVRKVRLVPPHLKVGERVRGEYYDVPFVGTVGRGSGLTVDLPTPIHVKGSDRDGLYFGTWSFAGKSAFMDGGYFVRDDKKHETSSGDVAGQPITAFPAGGMRRRKDIVVMAGERKPERVEEDANADQADVYAVLRQAFDDQVWDGLPWRELRQRTRLPKERLRAACDTLVSQDKAILNRGPDGVLRLRVRPGSDRGAKNTLADDQPKVVMMPLEALRRR